MGLLTPQGAAVYAPVMILVGLLLAILMDSYLGKGKRKLFLIIIVMVFSLVIQNYTGYLLDRAGSYTHERTAVGIYGYCVRPMILVLFCYIVDMEKKHRMAWVLTGMNGIVHLTALFSGICFRITDDNHFQRGPLGYTCHVVSGIMIAYLLWLTFHKYGTDLKREILIPVLNASGIILSVVLDSLVDYRKYPATFLTIAVVVCSVFYYIWLHQQFVREHEEDLKASQRIQIMMSQIQPHFLYNTLSAIQALCETEPGRASEVTGKFGVYLRQNMDSLNKNGLVSFDEEMEHTLIYAEIEMVRFPGIRLEKDIGDRDFVLPALTVQPMVENAIRHGIRGRKGGTVSVITRRRPDCHEIIISDNGRGFDTGKKKLNEGNHIGIRNVRDRIEQMCSGSFDLESVPEKGTEVTIRLPIQESARESGTEDRMSKENKQRTGL